MHYIITVELPTQRVQKYNLANLVSKGLTQEYHTQRNSTYMHYLDNAYITVPVTPWANSYATLVVGKIINIEPTPRPDYLLPFSKNQYFLATDELNTDHTTNYMRHDYRKGNKYLITLSIYYWAARALTKNTK